MEAVAPDDGQRMIHQGKEDERVAGQGSRAAPADLAAADGAGVAPKRISSSGAHAIAQNDRSRPPRAQCTHLPGELAPLHPDRFNHQGA